MVVYLTREQRIARRKGIQPPTVEHYDENGESIIVVSPAVEIDVPTEEMIVKPAKKRKTTKKTKETKDEV